MKRVTLDETRRLSTEIRELDDQSKAEIGKLQSRFVDESNKLETIISTMNNSKSTVEEGQ